MMASWLLVALAVTADAPSACDALVRQDEINMCLSEEFSRSDTVMSRTYTRAMAEMRERDGFAQQEGQRAGFAANLLASQRAWLRYRDAHCEVESDAARGGTLAPALYSICMRRVTEMRTTELRRVAEGN
jgi:uncharacterized protein YecT (DUF1311 family)